MKSKPEQQTVEIRQPFLGVETYCVRCRKAQIAPWLPAMCRICGAMMRVAT